MRESESIKRVLVLGGGSAGLLSALTVKRLLPSCEVKVLHSEKIGVIGVGEGTTAVFPEHLFQTLGISPERFYREAQPTWKIGIKFEWGARGSFFYDFGFQYDARFQGMSHATGYYADEDCRYLNEFCSLMEHGKAFASGPLNRPVIKPEHAFHIENRKLVSCLRSIAEESGVSFEDDTLQEVRGGPQGVDSLIFESGAEYRADLYLDCSGFRSELLGRHFKEPFKSFLGGLFCDRAMVGGWEREEEEILPYTTAETMDSGWSWRIEHEHFINRGYVYSSEFISDDEAAAEFLKRNPKVKGEPRVVSYKSGRYERNWVGNVVAIGNASGFVEPLEATALAQIIYEVSWLSKTLKEVACRPNDTDRERYNHAMARAWDEIRDFLAFHYKFNTLRDTPFWHHCQNETSLGSFEGFYEAFRKIGPSHELIKHLPFHPNIYGIEGYLAMLVGMNVPYDNQVIPSAQEKSIWKQQRARNQRIGKQGLTVKQALAAIRKENWRWPVSRQLATA